MSIYIAFSDFLIYLRLHKGRSRKTQEQYAFHIWRFILWIVDDITEKELSKYSYKDFLPPDEVSIRKKWHSPLLLISRQFHEPRIEEIKKEDFDEWRLSLSDMGLSIKTTNAHIVTMRSWLKYLKKEEIRCVDPTSLDLMKAPDREVTFLTVEEIKRFFESIDRNTLIGKRDFAICACIYATGLRISELTRLNREDINLETMEFGVRGKGGKLRVVYLTNEARYAIENYLNARDDEFVPLFIRHNLKMENIDNTDDKLRLSRFFITNMIKSYGLKAGIIKNMHAHALRHSFATTLLTNGADIRIIQELLGHSSITTTQVYTHITNPKLKEAHKKYFNS